MAPIPVAKSLGAGGSVRRVTRTATATSGNDSKINVVSINPVKRDQPKAKPNQKKGRVPKCARCANHGLVNPVKSHKLLCLHRYCKCVLCRRTEAKQLNMASKLTLRRMQALGSTAAVFQNRGGHSKSITGPETDDTSSCSNRSSPEPEPKLSPELPVEVKNEAFDVDVEGDDVKPTMPTEQMDNFPDLSELPKPQATLGGGQGVDYSASAASGPALDIDKKMPLVPTSVARVVVGSPNSAFARVHSVGNDGSVDLTKSEYRAGYLMVPQGRTGNGNTGISFEAMSASLHALQTVCHFPLECLPLAYRILKDCNGDYQLATVKIMEAQAEFHTLTMLEHLTRLNSGYSATGALNYSNIPPSELYTNPYFVAAYMSTLTSSALKTSPPPQQTDEADDEDA